MVSLVKSLAASLYAVVHSVPYQYQLDNFQQVKNVSLFFGRDYTINKQEKLHGITNRIESIRIANWNALVHTVKISLSPIMARGHQSIDWCRLLWAYYNCDTSTIRVRFEHDSATTRYEMRTIRVRFERDTTSYEELCAFEQ